MLWGHQPGSLSLPAGCLGPCWRPVLHTRTWWVLEGLFWFLHSSVTAAPGLQWRWLWAPCTSCFFMLPPINPVEEGSGPGAPSGAS